MLREQEKTFKENEQRFQELEAKHAHALKEAQLTKESMKADFDKAADELILTYSDKVQDLQNAANAETQKVESFKQQNNQLRAKITQLQQEIEAVKEVQMKEKAESEVKESKLLTAIEDQLSQAKDQFLERHRNKEQQHTEKYEAIIVELKQKIKN